MNLLELLQIASSEEKSEEFLRQKGVLKTFDSCHFCNAKNIGKVRRNFLSTIIAEQNGALEKIAYSKI
jgi:transposase